MNFSMSLFSLLGGLLVPGVAAQGLNVTAISAVNGASVLECWNLAAPPKIFAGAVNYPLGSMTDAFVGVIPPKTHIGFAHAPSAQFSLVMAGLVHIRLPNSTTEAWIQGGKYGFIVAVDTKDVSKAGHITDFPGAADTVIAQFPFADGKIPDHEVISNGPCDMSSLVTM